jgi:Fic family protein
LFWIEWIHHIGIEFQPKILPPPHKSIDIAGQTETFGDFSLRKFLTRYICGDSALKECRQVSRNRLALAAIGLNTTDIHAILLHNTIERYEQARNMLIQKKSISIETLCEINGLFTADKKFSGKVRTSQNWIGKSLDKATYTPPPADHLPELLNEWLDFTNAIKANSHPLAILSYVRLILIHPFYDANGRTARLVYDMLMSLNDPNFVHLALYRMGIAPTQYKNALWSFGVKTDEGLQHPYWQQALIWTHNYKTQAIKLLKATQALINNKLGLSSLNANDKTLLNHLWAQPVISLAYLQDKFGWDSKSSHLSIEKFIHLNILKMYRSKTDSRTSIFVCEDMFQTWQLLDELVFADKMLAVKLPSKRD